MAASLRSHDSSPVSGSPAGNHRDRAQSAKRAPQQALFWALPAWLFCWLLRVPASHPGARSLQPQSLSEHGSTTALSPPQAARRPCPCPERKCRRDRCSQATGRSSHCAPKADSTGSGVFQMPLTQHRADVQAQTLSTRPGFASRSSFSSAVAPTRPLTSFASASEWEQSIHDSLGFGRVRQEVRERHWCRPHRRSYQRQRRRYPALLRGIQTPPGPHSGAQLSHCRPPRKLCWRYFLSSPVPTRSRPAFGYSTHTGPLNLASLCGGPGHGTGGETRLGSAGLGQGHPDASAGTGTQPRVFRSSSIFPGHET